MGIDKSDLPIALRAAYLAMHRQTDSLLRPHGVTADQFVLMASLSRGVALTQRELARRMSSDPSTVRAMLVLLERQGLVVRDTHQSDSRARTVSLTYTGKRKFRQLWKESESLRTTMFDSIPSSKMAPFVEALLRLSEVLNGIPLEPIDKGTVESEVEAH